MIRFPKLLLFGLLVMACATSLPGAAEAGKRRATVDPEGSLDKDQIRDVVRAHIDEVRRCYNSELVRDPDLAGRLVAQFVIAPDGKVRESSISESNLPVEMDTCIANAIKGWSFPEPEQGGKVMVSYPFAFEPG